MLSACDSGLSVVRPGDELMGLGAALLCLGTRTSVAPVVAVPDTATMPLMLALHDGLGRGLPPAEALAAARSRPGSLGGAGPLGMTPYHACGAREGRPDGVRVR